MAFTRWQRAASKKAPERSWDKQEMKIIGWCLTRNIKIGISPDWKDEMNRWQIDIKVRNSRWHTDPKRYDDHEVFESLIKYYKYYYDKYNK